MDHINYVLRRLSGTKKVIIFILHAQVPFSRVFIPQVNPSDPKKQIFNTTKAPIIPTDSLQSMSPMNNSSGRWSIENPNENIEKSLFKPSLKNISSETKNQNKPNQSQAFCHRFSNWFK